MKNYLYFKNGKFYLYQDNKEVEISLEKIDDFIKLNKKSIFYLIFSKLDCYFRKAEFYFKDRKKINLILGQEIEGKFPKSIENFYFHFQFYCPQKNKTFVNIFGIEKEKVDFLKNIFKKNKVKLYFTIDSLLLHQFLKEEIKEKEYIELYIENKYLLINLIEDSEISGVYSYFSENVKEDFLEIFSSLFFNKKLPVYFIGNREIYEEMKLDGSKFLFEKSFFDILKEIKKIQIISLNPINFPKKIIKIEYIISLLILFIISFFLTRPYFLKIKKEKKLEEINLKMENIYKSLFPEAKKIINPLVQIKEKLGENSNYLKLPISDISIINILEEITSLFPENINAEIEGLTFNNGSVNVIGIVDNLENLDIVKENLKNSGIFKRFDFNNISFTKENKIRFDLSLRIEK
ncbi:MAG: hypothetical protein NC833_01625 [Candidatus Omnitrophica bacterium]|nr:hypothetical protein [Candidatus Omnitrophota bacterium]